MNDIEEELMRLKATYQSAEYAALAEPISAAARPRARWRPQLIVLLTAGAVACFLGLIVWGIPNPGAKMRRQQAKLLRKADPVAQKVKSADKKQRTERSQPWLPSFALARYEPRTRFGEHQSRGGNPPPARGYKPHRVFRSFRLPAKRISQGNVKQQKRIRFQYL